MLFLILETYAKQEHYLRLQKQSKYMARTQLFNTSKLLVFKKFDRIIRGKKGFSYRFSSNRNSMNLCTESRFCLNYYCSSINFTFLLVQNHPHRINSTSFILHLEYDVHCTLLYNQIYIFRMPKIR